LWPKGAKCDQTKKSKIRLEKKHITQKGGVGGGGCSWSHGSGGGSPTFNHVT